ncbi:MAG: putative tryptophan--tRNA ligase, partial [Terrestrivirus sp.]
MKHAYSGGGGDGSLADHRKYGGDITKDISYQYLRYFEFDDVVLEDIRDRFQSGEMTCGEIKKIMA